MKNYTAHFLIPLLSLVFGFFLQAERVDASVIIRPPNNLSLVGYWSFDEGVGTSLGDLSGNGNDGTLNGDPRWVSGKFSGALEFDGVGDYVDLTDSFWSDRFEDQSTNTNDFTISAWVKIDSYPTESTVIVGQRYGDTMVYGIRSSGKIYLSMDDTRGNSPVTDTALSLNTWYHVTAVFSGEGQDGSSVQYFVNGSADGGGGLWDSNGSGAQSWLFLGYQSRSDTGADDYLSGRLDEVRIYSRALSAAEVQSLYNNTKSTVVGEVSSSYYSDGLVAHYTFDGATLSGSTVSDIVGDNHGTIEGAAVPTMGRIGQALEFGSSGDYVQLPSSLEGILNGISDASLSMWVKLDSDQNSSGNAGIIQLSGHTSSNGNLYYYTDSSRDGGIWLDIFRTSRVFTGDWQPTFPGIAWHHLVITTTPGTNGWKMYLDGVLRYQTTGEAQVSVDSSLFGGFRIGQNSGGRRLGGKIDDVRIYNRALSVEEVAGIAGRALGTLNSSTNNLLTNGLAGFWTFDSETISGSTVSDVSGNEKSGTIVGTTPSIVSGRIGDSLEFTGTTGYINFNAPLSSPNDWTYSFWFYPTGAPDIDWAGLAGQGNNPRVTHHTNLTVSTGAAYQAGGWAGGAGTSESLALNTWHHVTAVWKDGSSATPSHDLYVNGVVAGSRTYSGAIILPSGTHHVNRRDSNSTLKGRVDDMRVYSRALSASEAVQLYQMGN